MIRRLGHRTGTMLAASRVLAGPMSTGLRDSVRVAGEKGTPERMPQNRAGLRASSAGRLDAAHTAHRSLVVALTCVALLAFASPVSADGPAGSVPAPDPTSVAQARSLFEQGLAAADRQDWATAVDLFSRSITVRPSPSVEFNLGLALVQLGRRAEARAHLIVARDRTSDPAVRERARTEVAGLERVLGRVVLQLAAPLGAAELRLDGRVLPAPAPGTSTFVDAGGHVFAIVRGGRDVDWAAVEVQSGATVVVALDPSRAAPPPRHDATSARGIQRELRDDGEDDGAIVVRRSRRERERSTSVLERWWFWAAIGVVVAGAATATAVAVSSGGEDPYRGNLGVGTVELP